MNKTSLTTAICGTMIAFASGQNALATTYSNVQVNGNGRIEDGIVLSIAGLVPGKDYSASEINDALQRLYASGLFDQAEIVPNGNSLVINVAENATVGRVYFEGNQNVDDEQLAEFVKIGPRSGLDRAQIETDAQNIRRLYAAQSRFDATVTPVVIPVNEGVYNVVFEINEGTIADVERLTFQGNYQVSDWQLRRTVSTGETGLFSGLFSRDNFVSEKILSDQSRLENYYQENGFYNARIRATSTDYNALGDYYLTYTIDEGRKFYFGNVNFSNEMTGVDAQQFAEFIQIQTGKVYKQSDIRKTIEAIEKEANFRGYPFLRVEPVVVTNEATGQLDVTLRLYQTPRVYVDRIDIHGNDVTLDRVIRRQFDVVEGDPMNARKLTEARQRLERLGFFSRVEVNARESSVDGRQIVDVEVEEQNTGSLNFGANYSGGAGLSAFVTLSEKNFLGRGQYVSATIDAGKYSQTAKFSFTEPGLFERDVAAGFDLYYQDSNRTESLYQATNIGFEPRVSFPTGENSRLTLNYFIRSNEIRDVSSATSPLIIADEGRLITSGIGATWFLDNTNSLQSPTKGWYLRLGGNFAGLGGDSSYLQLGGKAKLFYPVFSEDFIFSAEVEGGSIQSLNDQSIRVTDRYFLGTDSFLGFSNGGLGPRDQTDDVNSSLGGNNYAAFRTDFTFPTFLPEELGLRGQVFYNAGSVWGLDRVEGGASGVIDDSFHLRQSAGAGLLWNIGGAELRFSWTEVLEKQDYDLTRNFQVSFASSF